MIFNGATIPSTLTLGPTSLNTISSPMSSFSYKVRGISTMGGSVPIFETLTVNIYHECYAATIAPPSILPTINVQILNPSQTFSVSALLVQNPSTCAITYTLIDLSTLAAPNPILF